MTDTKLLKAKIMENGYIQADIAKMLNISPASLNKRINNKADFTAPQIKTLMDALKISDIIPVFFA